MRKAEKVERAELDLGAVLEPIRMGWEVPPEQSFERLEEFIDRAREHLKSIPDPIYRAEVRKLYREVIEDSLSLKLEQILRQKVA